MARRPTTARLPTGSRADGRLAAALTDLTAGRTLPLEAMVGLNRYRAFAATPDCRSAEAFVVALLPTYRELVRH